MIWKRKHGVGRWQAEYESQIYHLLTKEIKLLQTIDRLKVLFFGGIDICVVEASFAWMAAQTRHPNLKTFRPTPANADLPKAIVDGWVGVCYSRMGHVVVNKELWPI